MKRFFFVALIPFFVYGQSFCCPTCVGHVAREINPFFSSDFYQPDRPTSSETKEAAAQKELKKILSQKRSR